MDIFSSVDVFHGNSVMRLPKAEGISAHWRPFKGRAGNTNPAAVLPFGKYSVCAYSGGYPTGYGICRPNSGEAIRPLSDELLVDGFSHLQQSGTGAIRVYYNYAVVRPSVPGTQKTASPLGSDPSPVCGEQAHPGYYEVCLKNSGIFAQLTVSRHAAYHQYTFPEGRGQISIDFQNDGLSMSFDQNFRQKGTDLSVNVQDASHVCASVTLQGIRMHFAVSFEVLSSENVTGALDDRGVFTLSGGSGIPVSVLVRVSYSAQSMEDAQSDADHAAGVDFATVLTEAERLWQDALGKIEIDCSDPEEEKLFYSAFYHTLIKPSDWNGGGFLWQGAPFVVDFATFWDIYKTALPLIYTLYPEVSSHIAAMLAKTAQTLGQIPNALLLTSNTSVESLQARMLPQYTLYDAWKRGVKANWPQIVQTLADITDNEEFRHFEQTGHASRATHTLDMSEAGQCLAEMCRYYHLDEAADRLEAQKDTWKNAFDPQTGLLTENSEYYEGNHRNYSFRLFHDMPARMALCGGKEAYVTQLDHFFGFAGDDACFEGFNNETDMEAPFAYHAAGAHDRIVEILSNADRYVFRNADGTAGPDALPGNNDSGGLSACYLWNTLGLFPVTGQDKMLITRPKFTRSQLHLSEGQTLTIVRCGNGTHLERARLNGTDLPDLTVPVTLMMTGGTLEITVV